MLLPLRGENNENLTNFAIIRVPVYTFWPFEPNLARETTFRGQISSRSVKLPKFGRVFKLNILRWRHVAVKRQNLPRCTTHKPSPIWGTKAISVGLPQRLHGKVISTMSVVQKADGQKDRQTKIELFRPFSAARGVSAHQARLDDRKAPYHFTPLKRICIRRIVSPLQGAESLGKMYLEVKTPLLQNSLSEYPKF